MLKLGEKQNLKVVKEVDFGIYLASAHPATPEERVLLPIKQRPSGIGIGDWLDVFVYRDSDDRLIATTAEPFITLGQVARLRVKEVGDIGAFLDWGLEKDLLLPFREQTRPVATGEEINAALYIDRSDRLAATMKIYPYLATDSPYKKNDMVQGEIYELSENFGAFVAVDNRYQGLITPREMSGQPSVGDSVHARVTFVKPDGKLDLSLRPKAHLQIGADAERIFTAISTEYGGALPFSDKAPPEQIRSVFDMSKNEFKRAVGNLLKARRIEIGADEIRVL